MKMHGRHWRRRLVGLLFPSGKVALPLAAFCAAALAWIFGCGLDSTPAAYAVYAVSFYALVAFTGWTVRAGRRGWRRVSALPLVAWWQADACQRVRAGLALSLLVNLCYAGCKIVSAVLYTSVWEAALGVYYLLLCGVRAFLLCQMPAAGGEDRSKRGLLAYRRTGWFLLGLALALTSIAVQIVRDGRRYDYPGTLIYAAAAYAFYCLTAAIVNAVRYRRFHSPVLSAAKAVSLTTALVSIFSLETAMLARFGGEAAFQFLMTACTAAAVCGLVLGLALFMICSAGRQMQRFDREDRI